MQSKEEAPTCALLDLGEKTPTALSNPVELEMRFNPDFDLPIEFFNIMNAMEARKTLDGTPETADVVRYSFFAPLYGHSEEAFRSLLLPALQGDLQAYERRAARECLDSVPPVTAHKEKEPGKSCVKGYAHLISTMSAVIKTPDPENTTSDDRKTEEKPTLGK